MRKHYATLCLHRDTEVTYIVGSSGIEVTFEQVVYNGFNSLVLTLNGKILSCHGFTNAEVSYFQLFLERNKGVIENWVIADA